MGRYNIKFCDLKVGMEFESNKYGRYKILNLGGGYTKIIIEFIVTGYITSVYSQSICKGEVKDKYRPVIFGVGYMGEGKYRAGTKSKNDAIYNCWLNMIKRCYSPKLHKQKPYYKGCIVEDKWHNFQNFAEWYENNYPQDGGVYQLDKDIKVEGNKIYGEGTCMFVTPSDNSEAAVAKHYKFISPSGDVVSLYNLAKFCRAEGLSDTKMTAVNNNHRNHHRGWTKFKGDLDGK